MLCKCRVCGETEGKDISQWLYEQHARSARLQDALQSLPLGSTTLASLANPPSSDAPKVESSGADSTFKIGREVVGKLMMALDDIAVLQRTHRRLRRENFDQAELVTVPPPRKIHQSPDKRPVLPLDAGAPVNRRFLDYGAELRRLLQAVEALVPAQMEVTMPTLNELKDDVLQSIMSHDEMALRASNTTYERQAAYVEEGFDAEIVVPVLPTYRHLHPLHLAFMFLAALIHYVVGCSEAATLLIMQEVHHVVRISMQQASKEALEGQLLSPEEEAILRHLPLDVQTAVKHYRLLPNLTIYACCPRCSFLYSPLSSDSEKPYQDRCTHVDLQQSPCNEPLLRSRVVGDRLEWRAIRRYAYRDPADYVGTLFSRPDMEEIVDAVVAKVKEVSTDIWDSEYLTTIRGPDKLLFFDEPGRLVFAVGIDWFNPYTNLEAKKKWSIGAVYLVCLNLPPELRFRLENVCLIGIIPGPKEPSLEKVNHFLKPMVDSFIKMYNPGLWVEHTAKYPTGRLIRAIIALLVADLLGARHCAGFTFPGHTYFCSYCMLTKQSLDNFDPSTWPPRVDHAKHAREWRDAPTAAARDAITNTKAVRWSDLNLLPGFNMFLGLPPCLVHAWHAVCTKHCRGAWHMSISVDAGDGTYDPFYEPPELMTMARAEHTMLTQTKTHVGKLGIGVIRELCLRRGIRTGGLVKKRLLEELHEWRISRGIIDANGKLLPGQADVEFTPPTLEELCRSLKFEEDESRIDMSITYIFRRKKPPQPTTIATRLSAPVLRTLCLRYANDPTGSKAEMASRLVGLRTDNGEAPQEVPLAARLETSNRDATDSSGFPRFVPIMGSKLLGEVQSDIGRTFFPEWYKPAPKNLGDIKHGKLSSKEWKATFTTSFPITLVRAWGTDYHGKPSKGQHEALDNFLHLALAIILSLQTEITDHVIELYKLHITTYLEGFKLLYPTHSITPYHHICLHVPDFLKSIGPWMLSGSGPFEGYNEACQKMTTNSIFGDLEVTIMRKFSVNSQLRGLASSGMLPPEVSPMGQTLNDFLESSRLGGLGRNLAAEYADPSQYTVVPAEPLRLISVPPRILQAMALVTPTSPPKQKMAMCEMVMRGNMEFSIGKRSSLNSQISYRSINKEVRYGRIFQILQEPDSKYGTKRTFVVAERYQLLNIDDNARDPYWNHPLLGKDGYQMCRLVYSQFSPDFDVFLADDIIGHVAICPIGQLPSYLLPLIVTVQLDRAYLARHASLEVVNYMKAKSRLPSRLPYANTTPAVVSVASEVAKASPWRSRPSARTPTSSDDDDPLPLPPAKRRKKVAS